MVDDIFFDKLDLRKYSKFDILKGKRLNYEKDNLLFIDKDKFVKFLDNFCKDLFLGVYNSKFRYAVLPFDEDKLRVFCVVLNAPEKNFKSEVLVNSAFVNGMLFKKFEVDLNSEKKIINGILVSDVCTALISLLHEGRHIEQTNFCHDRDNDKSLFLTVPSRLNSSMNEIHYEYLEDDKCINYYKTSMEIDSQAVAIRRFGKLSDFLFSDLNKKSTVVDYINKDDYFLDKRIMLDNCNLSDLSFSYDKLFVDSLLRFDDSYIRIVQNVSTSKLSDVFFKRLSKECNVKKVKNERLSSSDERLITDELSNLIKDNPAAVCLESSMVKSDLEYVKSKCLKSEPVQNVLNEIELNKDFFCRNARFKNNVGFKDEDYRSFIESLSNKFGFEGFNMDKYFNSNDFSDSFVVDNDYDLGEDF